MEKRGEGKEGIPVLALAKCLLVSYVLTLLLLCLLALLLYKLHLTEGIVTIAISAIYVATTFTAGLLAGKENGKAEIPMGSFHGSGIFCNPGGGVGADQDTGDRIRQFLLDYHGIVRGRGNAGRNARVKSR